MTGTKLQELLDAHCLEMKANMPGFLFYGILSCKDGTILSKASANEESSRIVEQGSAFHLTIVEQVKKVVTSSESLGVKETHSILIETDKVTNVIGVSNSGKYFILLALDRAKANIAIARTLVERSRSLAGALDEHL